jgi:SAM-dependent methyltransferase
MQVEGLIHKGVVVSKKGKDKVIDCEACGFKHLFPIPNKQELSDFYKDKYYDLIKKGGRAPELRRQMQKGSENERGRKWLENTMYLAIENTLRGYLGSRQGLCILDVGRGNGDFLRYMKRFRWQIAGIEPDNKSEDPSLNVKNMTLENFVHNYFKDKRLFDAITILNVLEHVPDPRCFLKLAKELLNPEHGILCLRVPNDFNILQLEFQKKTNRPPWWVAVPDHINYFSGLNLNRLLTSVGFDILYSTVDFPMELFLLMGDDYVGNPELGTICHEKRINFELSISTELRRKIYKSMAESGIGRDLMVFARIKDKKSK